MVEVKIECKDVDAGFTEEAELSALSVARDQFADGVFGEVALTGDAVDLELGGGGGDVWVEP